MRIISSKFKGHKLNIPKNFLIIPTTDRFKESLFSIINSEKYSSNIDGKYFLDLCSGSGGIGIEAFSRGAKKVYMIDKNQNAINLINKNLSKILFVTSLFLIMFTIFLTFCCKFTSIFYHV